MEQQLPTGWRRLEDDAGLIYYLTRHPEVKISRRSHLENYHRKGRYREMSLSDLDFGKKRRANKYSFTETNVADEGEENVKKPKLEVMGCCNNAVAGLTVSAEKNDGAFAFEMDDPDRVDLDKSEYENESWLLRSDKAEEQPTLTSDESDNETQDLRRNKSFKHRRSKVSKGPFSDKTESASNLFSAELDSFDLTCEEMEEMDGEEDVGDIPQIKTREEVRKETFIANEQRKLEEAVKKLTLTKNNAVDHKEALVEAAKSLSDLRKNAGYLAPVGFEDLKSQISSSETPEDLVQILNSSSEVQQLITSNEHSKILEQLLRISSLPDNPINDFPLNINRNHYSDLINFALVHAPDVLALVMKIATKNEAPIAANDVVRCAYMFSSLACSVSRANNALKKTKSVSTKNNGLTNNGLDVLANVGVFETSRSYRNDRDFLASLAEHILKSYAKNSVPQVKC